MERKDAFAPLLALGILILALAPLASGQYGGGTGAPDDPYQIYTPQQMNAIGADPNDWDKHFKLMGDIDLSAYDGTEFNLVGVARARRRGDTSTEPGPFTGGFDGNGCTIFNFTWRSNNETNVGLFRYVADPNAKIKNLRIVDPNVSGQSSVGALVGYLHGGAIVNCSVQGGRVSASHDVGGLVGNSEGGGTIANCYAVDSFIAGERNIGGLLGRSNTRSVTDCHANSSVRGDGCVGGLVGWYGSIDLGADLTESGVMRGCHSSSSVVGEGAVGGLAGHSSALVTSCHASGAVSGNSSAGGLVGSNSGTITDSYATGDVLGTQYTGGLVGYGLESRIERCYASGDVSGDDCAGGLIGIGVSVGMSGGIASCYATGNVTGEFEVGGLAGCTSNDSITNCYSTGRVTGNAYTGGLLGDAYGSDVVGCFWDIDTSGQPESAGGSAKTSADMFRAATFLGWGGDVWTIDEGNDYPRLWWEDRPGQVVQTVEYPTGAGTADDPFLIYTAEEMALIGWFPSNWDKHFKLMADIDLAAFTGTSFTIIGTDYDNPFMGVFDGNGHTISNFTYKSQNARHVGLFGCVSGSNAAIRNLGLIDPNTEVDEPGTQPDESCLGTLVGHLYEGMVANCYTEGGIVSGNNSAMVQDNNTKMSVTLRRRYVPSDFIGGLVGRCSIGLVANCYSTVTVCAQGTYTGGGLIGCSSGTVADCYSTGMVIGGDFRVGGLIGRTQGGSVQASFWDIETSGQTESRGGTGLTTAEMQDPNTFITAGWDFFGPEDGPSNVWTVDPNTGYPLLWWQVPEEEWPESAQFAGGTGTVDDPYLIASAEQLNGIGYNPKLMESHFQLITDINLAGMDFFPIGTEGSPFTGVFDGDGWTISNLTCVKEDRYHMGLLGYVQGTDAKVRDLGLIDPNIDAGTGYYVGMVVGYLFRGIVSDCHVIGGIVSGERDVGGLVGYNDYGTITDCSVTAIVIGDRYTGGLLGFNDHGTVAECRSAASVTGEWHTGGLIGYNYRAEVADCYSTSVVVADRYTGGLIGCDLRGTMTNCYSAGCVVSESRVGGLIGSGLQDDARLSFWDVEVSGVSVTDGGVGLTTAEMMTAATFLEAGWDFAGETANGTEDIWWIDEGQGYPRLWWEGADAEF